jgi:predicted DNA-binding transcriptional regulator AlpA
MSHVNENPAKLKRRLLPVNEAAEYLGLAPKTLRNRLGPKAPDPFPVKPKKIGKKVLFDIRDLDAFVDSLTFGQVA